MIKSRFITKKRNNNCPIKIIGGMVGIGSAAFLFYKGENALLIAAIIVVLA